MRIKRETVELDYKDTKEFFRGRAMKYDKEHPYITTMYQDHNTALAEERDRLEREKILPYLELTEQAAVLDVACGVGRWADAVKTEIACYLGVDFSENLIRIAEERNQRENYHFAVGAAQQLKNSCKKRERKRYNRIISAGLFLYLNDTDVEKVMRDMAEVAEKEALLYIREPVGVKERLTLKKFYSEDLESEYNAIYRTREEYAAYMERTLFPAGFAIRQEGLLFEGAGELNNRKETVQYFYILKR